MTGPLDTAPIIGLSTAATVVVVLSIIGGLATLVVLFVQWYPRKVATDEPAAERGPKGPTDATYPPGSRPGGPGAEGMNVPAPGDISPSPRPPTETETES